MGKDLKGLLNGFRVFHDEEMALTLRDVGKQGDLGSIAVDLIFQSILPTTQRITRPTNTHRLL